MRALDLTDFSIVGRGVDMMSGTGLMVRGYALSSSVKISMAVNADGWSRGDRTSYLSGFLRFGGVRVSMPLAARMSLHEGMPS